MDPRELIQPSLFRFRSLLRAMEIFYMHYSIYTLTSQFTFISSFHPSSATSQTRESYKKIYTSKNQIKFNFRNIWFCKMQLGLLGWVYANQGRNLTLCFLQMYQLLILILFNFIDTSRIIHKLAIFS